MVPSRPSLGRAALWSRVVYRSDALLSTGIELRQSSGLAGIKVAHFSSALSFAGIKVAHFLSALLSTGIELEALDFVGRCYFFLPTAPLSIPLASDAIILRDSVLSVRGGIQCLSSLLNSSVGYLLHALCFSWPSSPGRQQAGPGVELLRYTPRGNQFKGALITISGVGASFPIAGALDVVVSFFLVPRDLYLWRAAQPRLIHQSRWNQT